MHTATKWWAFEQNHCIRSFPERLWTNLSARLNSNLSNKFKQYCNWFAIWNRLIWNKRIYSNSGQMIFKNSWNVTREKKKWKFNDHSSIALLLDSIVKMSVYQATFQNHNFDVILKFNKAIFIMEYFVDFVGWHLSLFIRIWYDFIVDFACQSSPKMVYIIFAVCKWSINREWFIFGFLRIVVAILCALHRELSLLH